MHRLVHLLSDLAVGGKERVALKLARRGRSLGMDHTLLLFDTPFRNEHVDLVPGDVPWEFLKRGSGLDMRFVRQLAVWLQHERIEVVHAHNDSALVYGVLAARRLPLGPRPRVIATFHTRPGHVTFLGRLMSRWASKRADVVTAVSPDLSSYLLATRWVAACPTLWNGVDLDEYRPDGPSHSWRERLGVPDGGVLVGHVGRFHPVKRQMDLMAAARALVRRNPPLVFVFVGQGAELPRFEAEAEREPNVRVVTRVQDMAAFFRALDIFVLCSSEEAAPLVLMEAMACGCASVATDVGGNAVLLGVEAGQSGGCLVPACRPEELATAIADLASDPALRADLGRLARARMAQFSEDREWQGYSRLYVGEPGRDCRRHGATVRASVPDSNQA